MRKINNRLQCFEPKKEQKPVTFSKYQFCCSRLRNNVYAFKLLNIRIDKKRHNATKPGFQRFNQVLMWQEKEMKDGSKEKLIPLFWLHWLHAPSLVSIGQSKLKLLRGNWISFFSTSDLDLDYRPLGSNPKRRLDVSYPYSKFGVNRPKQTKVIERKLNFYF